MTGSFVPNETTPADASAASLAPTAIALGALATFCGWLFTAFSLVALLAVLEPNASGPDDRLAPLAIPSVRMAFSFMSLAWTFIGGVAAGAFTPRSAVQNAAAAGALAMVPSFLACVPFDESVMSTAGALLVVPTAVCGGLCARLARPH
jgi:hypothetical protein